MTEPRQVPDVLLERFLADDLGADLRRTIEAERDTRPEVRARIEELAAERQAFLEADPPAEFARRLAGRLEMEGAAAAAVAAAPARPRRWVAWLLGPSVAAAAAAALVVTFTVTRSSDETPTVLMDAAPPAGAPVGSTSAPAATPTPAEAADAAAAAPVVRPSATPAREPAAKHGFGGGGGKLRKRKKERVKGSATGSPAPPKPTPVTTPPPPPESEPEPMEAAGAAAAEEAPTAPEDGGGRSAQPSGLSPREILQTVQREVADLHACVKPADDVPAGAYTVVIAWTITPRGTVEKPRLESPKSLRKTTLSRCLVREMRTWKFPRATSSTEATLPLKFEVK